MKKLELESGKLVNLGFCKFEFVVDDGIYKFIATDTNRYSVGEVEATPYGYTNYTDLKKPETRAKIYYGGWAPSGYLHSKVSIPYTGKFRDAEHYFDVVTALVIDTMSKLEEY